jgi:hypothetical protein
MLKYCTRAWVSGKHGTIVTSEFGVAFFTNHELEHERITGMSGK